MKRIGRGVSEGGQFAPHAQSAPQTHLAAPSGDGVSAAVVRFEEASWGEPANPFWGRDPATLTPQQALDAITDPDIVTRHTAGDCHILAHKVAEQTGWGLVIVGDPVFEADYCEDECPEDCTDTEHGSWAVENLFHAWARRPDGRLVDIRGVHEPQAADRLAETWGSIVHSYASAAEADRVWDHAQWASSDDDIEDADYVGAYVARYGAELDPLEASVEGWDEPGMGGEGAWPTGSVVAFPVADLAQVVAGDVEFYLDGVDGSGEHDEDYALGTLDPGLILDIDRFESMRDTLRRDGAVREPLVVHVYPETETSAGRAVLRDGHHRYFAARAVGIEHVPVIFHHGVPDEDEAYGWAFPTDEEW